MKAVILVGGQGTRLRPLTCNTPKAIVPILNQPFLVHLLRYLKRHGIKDIILAMGYLPDPIQSILGDGSQLGVRLTYLVEASPLGTAGAVKNAGHLLDGTFVVLNGDIITEIDLTDMIRKHRQVKPRATIALTPVDDPSFYGVVETDSQGMVKRFIEKPKREEAATNMINAGIYVMEPEVLAHIPQATHCMFERHVFPPLLDMGEPILSYPSNAYWIDIGTPEKYLQSNRDLLLKYGTEVRTEGKSQLHPGALIEGPALIGKDCVIAAGARIKGPAVLGQGCRIEGGAVVEGAVLWDDVRVGEGATLSNCIVCAHCQIDRHSHVPDDCVLGDRITVQQNSRLASGTKVLPENFKETA